MEELINSPEYQKILPYIYILLSGFILLLFLLIYLSILGRKTLLLIKKENRCVTPEQSWLLLLPFFHIYWNFIFMRRLVD
jgi:hypothetical protein